MIIFDRIKQAKATDPFCSVYVDASAGSGKTQILVDRILKLLLLTTSQAQNILCITHTNIAAIEMRERISQRTELWLVAEDKLLQEQIAELTGYCNQEYISKARSLHYIILQGNSKLRIQTIHSFAANLLQRYGILEDNNQSNYSQILNQNNSETLFVQHAYNIFAKLGNNPKSILSKVLQRLLQYYGITKLIGILYAVHQKINLHYFGLPNSISTNINKKCFSKRHIKNLYTNTLRSFLSFLQQNDSLLKLVIIKVQKSDNNLVKLLSLKDTKDYQEVYRVGYSIFYTKQNKVRIRSVVSSALLKSFPELKNFLSEARDLFIKCKEKIDNHLYINRISEVKFLSQHILSEYIEYKKKNSYLEYSDILNFALILLKNHPQILYQLDNSINHVLVDEAQDLSQAQWQLIISLIDDFFTGKGSSEINRTIFIVGDYKQSIFSFQGAQPEIFQNIKHILRNKIQDVKKQWCEVSMQVNFRSSPEILHAVNQRFISFPEHIPWLQEYSGKVEYMDSDIDISLTIDKWLKSERKIINLNRVIQPSDIMILVRRRNTNIGDLVKRLIQKNIPTAYDGNNKEHNIILILEDMLALVKFTLLPLNDLNLACLLKAPCFDISEKQLFTLAYKREGFIWDKIKELTQQNAQWAKTIYDNLQLLLNAYRKYTRAVDFLLYCQEYEDFSFLRKNICQDLLEAFKIEVNGNLQQFLDWAEQNRGRIMSTKLIYSENAIKVTTIHGAKGLEAPIVIVADALLAEHQIDDTIMLYQNEIIINDGTNIGILEEAKTHHRLNKKDEDERLLYVAMTRAQHELYLVRYSDQKRISEN